MEISFVYISLRQGLNKKNGFQPAYNFMVGMTGFEPTTSCSRNKRTTKLCYIPIALLLYFAKQIFSIVILILF